VARRDEAVSVDLPGGQRGPLRHIAVRLVIALGLVAFVALLTYFGRSGCVDPAGGSVSLLDAFYYSTVTITTTGYGDIRPVTDTARFVTTVLVTPARVLFLIILVGTTLEILAERSREAYRRNRWRKTLKDHVIICGFGTKGQSAVRTLRDKGCKQSEIVVIDERPDARSKATSRAWRQSRAALPPPTPWPRQGSTRPARSSWRSTATTPPFLPPSPRVS
jgi:voltage-gated potassium channel